MDCLICRALESLVQILVISASLHDNTDEIAVCSRRRAYYFCRLCPTRPLRGETIFRPFRAIQNRRDKGQNPIALRLRPLQNLCP